MFLGEYEHTIDDKGRMAIPARYRDQLGAGVIITRGFDACLIGFPRGYWEQLAQRVSALPFGQPGARELQRRLFAGAQELEFDRQGRILLPQNLREFGGLADGAIVAGMHDYFEIWARDRWQTMLQQMESESDSFATRLASLGI